MVSVFSSSAIGHGFELRSGQIKDYAIVFFIYFSAKHTLLMGTSKDWLVRNQNNALVVSVSKHYQIPAKGVGQLQSRHHYHHDQNEA